MATYYDELLTLCGFGPEEIDEERPRIEKAFVKLQMGPADIDEAVLWVKKHHDIELNGVRAVLRIWLKELFDLVLSKEEGKRLLYYGFPTIEGLGSTIVASADDVHATCPDILFCVTLGQIFNKLSPVFEAAEQNGLPPGHGLCSLQQLRVGGLARGITPVPDMVLTSSYFCDMGSKTDELLHERYGHPAVYVDGSMDSAWGEFPNYLPERVDLLGEELEKGLKGAREILGVEVTEEARHEVLTRKRELSKAMGELVELMKVADPQPISMVSMFLARLLGSGSASMRIMTEAPKAIDLLNSEIKDRMEKGIGVVEKGAPRILISWPHFSDPSIMHMMEECGLAMPLTLYASIATTVQKTVPFISGYNLADFEMSFGVFHSNYGIVSQMAKAIKGVKIDGVIWNYMFNCRPIAQSSLLLKQFVEAETGVPVLSLEMDIYDSRNYSAEALRTRVETFADMLRMKRASAIT